MVAQVGGVMAGRASAADAGGVAERGVIANAADIGDVEVTVLKMF